MGITLNDRTYPDDKVTPRYDVDDEGNRTTDGGITKREYFASKAMAALIAREPDSDTLSANFYNAVALDAVMATDALIKALNHE